MIANALAHTCCWPLSAVGPGCVAATPILAIDVLTVLTRTNERSFSSTHSPSASNLDFFKRVLLCYTTAEAVFYWWFLRKRRAAQARTKLQISTTQRRREIWEGEYTYIKMCYPMLIVVYSVSIYHHLFKNLRL